MISGLDRRPLFLFPEQLRPLGRTSSSSSSSSLTVKSVMSHTDVPSPLPKGNMWVEDLWYNTTADQSTSVNSQDKCFCWDRAIDDLLTEGNGSMAFLPLPDTVASELTHAWQILAEVFSKTLGGDGDVLDFPPPSAWAQIDDSADSAHCTGYHSSSPGFSRRYNAHRRGWVFSDEDWTCSIGGDERKDDELVIIQQEKFDHAMGILHAILHFILDNLLLALSRKWGLLHQTTNEDDKNTACWFQTNMGPTRSHSQWHVKEFVTPPNSNHSDSTTTTEEDSSQPVEWLPAHTDPSLVSVVIHDTQHKNMRGSRGLQYYSTSDKEWHPARPSSETTITTDSSTSEYPPQQYATIFVGSVLAAMTSHQVPACRHRVIYEDEENTSRSIDSQSSSRDPDDRGIRRATTLFGRPAPTAKLQHIPGFPRIRQEGMRFEEWLSRVARNYEKSKKNRTTKT